MHYINWKIKTYDYQKNPFEKGDKVKFIDNELNRIQFPDILNHPRGNSFQIIGVKEDAIYLLIGSGRYHYKRFMKA